MSKLLYQLTFTSLLAILTSCGGGGGGSSSAPTPQNDTDEEQVTTAQPTPSTQTSNLSSQQFVLIGGLDDSSELYKIDLDTLLATNLSPNMPSGGLIQSAEISNDKRLVAYLADQDINNTYQLFISTFDGEINLNLTNPHCDRCFAEQFDWNPDSNSLLYIAREPSISGDEVINIVDIDGTNTQTIYTSDESIRSAKWSPDGNKVAFATKGNVYVIEPATSAFSVIRYTDYDLPENTGDIHWSHDSQTIYFVSFDNLYKQDIDSIGTTAPSLIDTNVEALFMSSSTYFAYITQDERFSVFISDGNNQSLVHDFASEAGENYPASGLSNLRWDNSGRYFAYSYYIGVDFSDDDETLLLYDTSNNNSRRQITDASGVDEVGDISFSPNSDKLIYYDNNDVIVTTLSDFSQTTITTDYTVSIFRWLSNDRFITSSASASSSSSIQLFDLETQSATLLNDQLQLDIRYSCVYTEWEQGNVRCGSFFDLR